VPFRVGSGAPCNGTAGFWMYGETVRETAGVAATITQVFLRFLGPDPFPTSPGAANDLIAANGSLNYSWFGVSRRRSRGWCAAPSPAGMQTAIHSRSTAQSSSSRRALVFDGLVTGE